MNIISFLFSKTFLKHLVLVLVCIMLIGFIILQWLKWITNHNQYIQVPDLAKKSMYEARDILESNQLRYEVIDSSEYKPRYPKFSVITQDPKPGDHVKKHRKIYLTLNPSGHRKVVLPNLVQITRRNAESLLKAVGLGVGTVSYINDIGKDMILSVTYKGKEIQAGELIPRTSKVNLVCGNGLPSDMPEESPVDTIQKPHEEEQLQ